MHYAPKLFNVSWIPNILMHFNGQFEAEDLISKIKILYLNLYTLLYLFMVVGDQIQRLIVFISGDIFYYLFEISNTR